MKTIISISLLLFTLYVNGQEWAPIGAEWYYDETHAFSGNIDYQRIYCDSIIQIQGIDCKRINIDYNSACNIHFGPKLYTYSRGDTVYFYNSDVDKFEILYNFNTTIGDEWTIRTKDYDNNIDTVIIHVDSVSIIEINDKSLKKLFVSYIYKFDFKDNEPYIINSEIVQSLGDLHFLINIITEDYFVCDFDFIWNLRCYHDSELGFYSTGLRDSCTYKYIWTNINNELLHNISVFPNPVSDILRINTSETIYYEIYNLNGVLLKKGVEKDVNISNFSDGIYLLKLKANNIKTKTFRITKHKP